MVRHSGSPFTPNIKYYFYFQNLIFCRKEQQNPHQRLAALCRNYTEEIFQNHNLCLLVQVIMISGSKIFAWSYLSYSLAKFDHKLLPLSLQSQGFNFDFRVWLDRKQIYIEFCEILVELLDVFRLSLSKIWRTKINKQQRQYLLGSESFQLNIWDEQSGK